MEGKGSPQQHDQVSIPRQPGQPRPSFCADHLHFLPIVTGKLPTVELHLSAAVNKFPATPERMISGQFRLPLLQNLKDVGLSKKRHNLVVVS